MTIQTMNPALHRNDGTRDVPGIDSRWTEWVSASKTRNWCKEDPLLDWLDKHGSAKGFRPDNELESYDARTDFQAMILSQGRHFERVVMEYLEQRHRVCTIGRSPSDARLQERVEQAADAMRDGIPVVAQAPLWNPENRTYGMPDLLVRSDVLQQLFPDALGPEEAAVPAPALEGSRFHYRVVDIKFATIHLLKDGHVGAQQLPYMVQVWIYNEALGRLQGYCPPSAFLLGRGWKCNKERGSSALERLGRVDHGHLRRDGKSLAEVATAACTWIRRVCEEGAAWEVLPSPSVPELRPNMGYAEDAPWHLAKSRIAKELADLTLLPRVGPPGRAVALRRGIERWDDPGCNAAQCGVTGPAYGPRTDAVIYANQSSEGGPAVSPGRVTVQETLWRSPAPAEFFVDFETVSDLDDDFSSFPKKGGQPMIFMVGCGWFSDTGVWEFRCFTADRLDEDEERRILDAWIGFMRSGCAERGTTLEVARLFHWSPAEKSTLSKAYNSAAERQGLPTWDDLPWVDLLAEVVQKQPVTVRGAFNFGLKSIARAMHRHGLIETIWGDGPTDGLGAMVGAWWCNREARERGVSMRELDLMQEIERYNEVDCRTIAEILQYLRDHR